MGEFMSYNLKDFSKNYNNDKVRDNQINDNLDSFSQEEKIQAQKQAESLINQYKNMSNDELSQVLFNEIAKQKANGTFNKDKILAMLESVKGMIPNQNQYETLHNFIANL